MKNTSGALCFFPLFCTLLPSFFCLFCSCHQKRCTDKWRARSWRSKLKQKHLLGIMWRRWCCIYSHLAKIVGGKMFLFLNHVFDQFFILFFLGGVGGGRCFWGIALVVFLKQFFSTSTFFKKFIWEKKYLLALLWSLAKP